MDICREDSDSALPDFINHRLCCLAGRRYDQRGSSALSTLIRREKSHCARHTQIISGDPYPKQKGQTIEHSAITFHLANTTTIAGNIISDRVTGVR